MYTGQVMWPLSPYLYPLLQYKTQTQILFTSADDPSKMSLLRFLLLLFIVSTIFALLAYFACYFVTVSKWRVCEISSGTRSTIWRYVQTSVIYYAQTDDDDDDGDGNGEEEKDGKGS